MCFLRENNWESDVFVIMGSELPPIVPHLGNTAEVWGNVPPSPFPPPRENPIRFWFANFREGRTAWTHKIFNRPEISRTVNFFCLQAKRLGTTRQRKNRENVSLNTFLWTLLLNLFFLSFLDWVLRPFWGGISLVKWWVFRLFEEIVLADISNYGLRHASSEENCFQDDLKLLKSNLYQVI